MRQHDTDLYRLYAILAKRTLDIRPRTITDCIPNSHLASYSNFPYDECRELSYRATFGPKTSIERLSDHFRDHEPKEPWMLDEIDDLLDRFLTENELKTEQFFCLNNFESPLLRTCCFDEKVLKMRLSAEKVQSIWECPIVQDTAVNVCKTSTRHYFCEKFKDQFTTAYHRPQMSPEIEQSDEFKALNRLAKSFQEQNGLILNFYNHEMPKKSAKLFESKLTQFQSDSLNNSNKRLYSAVLQGENHVSEKKVPECSPDVAVLSREYPKYLSRTPCKCANCKKTENNNSRPNLFLPLIFHNRQLFQAPIFYPNSFPSRPWPATQFVPPNPIHLVMMHQTFHSFTPPPKRNNVLDGNGTIQDKDTEASCIPVRNSHSEDLELQALEQYASCSSDESVLEDLEQQATEQYDNL